MQIRGSRFSVPEDAAHIVRIASLFARAREYSRGNCDGARPAYRKPSLHAPGMRDYNAAAGVSRPGNYTRTEVAEVHADRERGPARAAALKGWLGSSARFAPVSTEHDHFCQRLEGEPSMQFHSLNRAYEDVPYTATADMGQRLWTGRTGVPMVWMQRSVL